MDPASTQLILTLVAAALFVAVNAFFVAAEYSLVALRRARVDALARAGDPRAARLVAALDRPHEFLATAQLGMTVASLGAGYALAVVVHATLVTISGPAPGAGATLFPLGAEPGLALVAVATGILAVAGLHAVLGTQVPKMLAVGRAEAVALWTVGPVLALAWLLRPVVWAFASVSRRLVAWVGVPIPVHSLARTPEEIRLLVERSHEEGMVEADEEQMIHGVFECRDLVAREVMTPRPDIVAVPLGATLREVVDCAIREGHSRLPVHDGGLDDIVGVLLVKDLLPALARGENGDFEIRPLLREPYFVPDTKRVDDLLAEFRGTGVHMAIVLDEFGGTQGLVTLEDLLEEIVGDIVDEHDRPEPDEVVVTPEGDVLLDGGLSIADVNARFGLDLPERDFDTIGGFVFGELGRIPTPGDVVSLNGSGAIRVEETEERRITRVRLTALPSGAGEAAADD